eukprot:g40238.t1
MDRDNSNPPVKVLNLGKLNYDNIRPEWDNVDWRQLFDGKSTSDMREYFKWQLIRVQERHIPMRMKDKYGKLCEPSMMRDVKTLVKKKKEAY